MREAEEGEQRVAAKQDAGSRGPAVAAGLVWVSLGLAVAATILVAGFWATQPPLPGRPDADPITTLVSLLGDLTARLAGAATLGGLAAGFAFLPLTASDADARRRRLARWSGRTAQLWCIAAVLMTAANPTFVTGTPLGAALRPQAWWDFVTATPSALAWLVTALTALVTAIAAYRAPRPAVLLLCWLAGVAATVFVAVTGNVSVGLNHDWATDAAAVAAVALVALASGAIGLTATAATGGELAAATRRYHQVAAPAIVVAAAGGALVAWQQLAGVPPLDTPAGVPVVTGFACLLALAISWLRRQVRLIRRGPAATGAAGDVALLIGLLTSLTAAQHLAPPRFAIPQSIQENYLGYEMTVPATFERLAGLGRPNLLWVVLVVLAVGGYLWGMVRVRRLGRHWPSWRLAFWLAGWGLTCYLAVSGLWEYSTAVFSWHMLVHMTINMMVPVLFVLGAPFSLIEAASRPRTAGDLPGAGELLGGLADNRLVHRLISPPVLWVVYLGSLFLVYFTPLFPALMKYHWAHQLMLLHFMVAGLAFFNLVVGPERQPWRLPWLVRFALLISVMPFHAIFAVGIMTARTVIGENFYRTLDVAWVGDLLADQGIAGQITWFTGEVPAIIAVVALAAQWFRSDHREAARADAQADLSGEDELTAYNAMLTALAERDRVDHDRPGRPA